MSDIFDFSSIIYFAYLVKNEVNKPSRPALL